MENNELQHWGIKGQKWGLRRFQNPDGSLTAAGRKRYGEEKEEPKKETPKPKTKEEVLKSGSAKELMEFKGDITNKEYEDAFKRLDYEKKMASYGQAETKTALDKFSDVMGKVDQARVGTQKAIDAYNVIAKVNNTFNPKFRLPEINSGNVNKRLQEAEDRRAKAREDKESAEKIARLEKLEREYMEKGADALKGLNEQDLNDLAARTGKKKGVKESTDKYRDKSENTQNQQNPKTDKTDKNTKQNPKTDNSDNKQKTAEAEAKLSELVNKNASKKVNDRTLTPDEQAKMNLKKANQNKVKTKSAISAWIKAGRSVSEIAERLGLSESTVRNYLEELT